MIAEKIHIKEMIGGRYDNSFVLYHHRLSNFKFPCSSLSRFLADKPQYGAGEAGIPRESNKSPRYIRITDIDWNGTLDDSLGVTAKTVEDKYILNNNDILIARSGNTVGKSYIHKTVTVDEPCFFAGYLIRFVVDSSLISPDYIFIFTKLSVYSDWVKVTQRVTGQPNINAEEYSNLPIPLPSFEVQQEIIDIYSKAQQARLEKRQKAKQLLESIDDYLLETLQIEKKQQKKEKRSQALRNISSIIGGRLDVPFLKGIEDAITEIKRIQHKTLGEIADFASENWDQKSLFEGRFPYVEISAIDTTIGVISAVEEVPMSNPPSRAKKILRKNDILISTTRPNRGAICIYNGDNISIASTGFSIIRNVKDNILQEYLSVILRSSISLKQMELRSSGGNYPAIIESELKRIIIPIPSIEIQSTIVNEIHSMKNKAKQLQKEGDALLEEAKQKIEKMIIG